MEHIGEDLIDIQGVPLNSTLVNRPVLADRPGPAEHDTASQVTRFIWLIDQFLAAKTAGLLSGPFCIYYFTADIVPTC